MILDFNPDAAVGPEQRRDITARLAALAAEEGARVLLCVESGSRAWGFHSPDSDYDIRFLYVRPADAYLALRPPRDVIERPIVGEIDIGGWDLGKALRLMARGNAIVGEWLTSPIVYAEAPGFREAFTPLVQAWRGSFGDVAHYYGLARRQWGSFIENRDEVKLKKYFYVLRPAITLDWLRRRPGEPAPMNLPALVEGLDLPAATAEALQALREAKQAAGEGVGIGPRVPALDAYVGEVLGWAHGARRRGPDAESEGLWARSDAMFRDWVRLAG
ncbi:putative nucleotidyltransferase [Caulobacter ginsengisoli]|uniref:Nucleotidyltransferase n=1 Tax=Caulobacter ginsengisoli TaxID=400775 RepID=A0ABU0IUV0_9CAUL|nr:nucleotidyltransferase domain-containing protein [Caulobacter ginsengisoli]MDQ0464732.1 putative nucleotidyltransferase [Caulobacter ginsengisoli]